MSIVGLVLHCIAAPTLIFRHVPLQQIQNDKKSTVIEHPESERQRSRRGNFRLKVRYVCKRLSDGCRRRLRFGEGETLFYRFFQRFYGPAEFAVCGRPVPLKRRMRLSSRGVCNPVRRFCQTAAAPPRKRAFPIERFGEKGGL